MSFKAVGAVFLALIASSHVEAQISANGQSENATGIAGEYWGAATCGEELDRGYAFFLSIEEKDDQIAAVVRWLGHKDGEGSGEFIPKKDGSFLFDVDDSEQLDFLVTVDGARINMIEKVNEFPCTFRFVKEQ